MEWLATAQSEVPVATLDELVTCNKDYLLKLDVEELRKASTRRALQRPLALNIWWLRDYGNEREWESLRTDEETLLAVLSSTRIFTL